MVEKQDSYVSTFMGTSYKVGNPRTIGELRSVLEEIIADLPSDNDLEISEVYLGKGELNYTLVDGITQ